MDRMGKTEYIIEARIRQYEHDIQCCKDRDSELEKAENEERIRQDTVIIEELKKILTGHRLEFLSYVFPNGFKS